jgi:NADH dehydrogenase (ubiquinone) Fe-S protein 3
VPNQVEKKNLVDLGSYIHECLPKYVQQTQLATGNELEILVHPEGVLPVLWFLKNNTLTQFNSFIDLTAIDVPTRQYRFEVSPFRVLLSDCPSLQPRFYPV